MNKDIISGSVFKLLRHKEFVNREKTPISAQFILTNKCNLSCIFCCNKKRWGPESMTKEFALRTLKDLKDMGTKAIEFTGGSEPLMHPDFEEVLSYCIELGMMPALVTNGIKLSGVSRNLLEQLDWIRISINASKSLYRKIHGIEGYDKVLDGLKSIDDLGISNKGVSYIFCKDSTLEDAQTLINDLQGFSLDYFRFSVDVFSDLRFNINPSNLKSDRFPIVSHSERPVYIPKKCGIFYYKPVIDCSGLIYPCCTNMHKEILPLGKISDMKSVLGDKSIMLDTSKCEYCIYGNANDLIAEMDKPIKNEKFV